MYDGREFLHFCFLNKAIQEQQNSSVVLVCEQFDCFSFCHSHKAKRWESQNPFCHFLTSFSIYPACEVIFFRQLGSNLNIKICKKQFRNTSQCEPNTQGLVANSTVFCRITVIVIPFLGVQVQISTILHSFSIRLTFQPGFI